VLSGESQVPIGSIQRLLGYSHAGVSYREKPLGIPQALRQSCSPGRRLIGQTLLPQVVEDSRV
jgi:hypothetical protein